MKKISYLLLSILVIFSAMSLCACGGDDSKDSANEEKTTNSQEATTENNTEEATTEEADDKVTYKVTVVDEAGNAIAGAMVQICDEACIPGVADDNGVAEFKVVEANYKASLVTLPEGYTYAGDEQEFYFEDGSTELTITLKAE